MTYKQTFKGIFLDIVPYCDGCPYFEAETEKTELSNIEDGVTFCNVRIICGSAGKCRRIYEYLKKSTKTPRPIVTLPKTHKIEYEYPFNEEGGFDE